MSTNLDFDYLSELFKSNPDKFEELRAQEIEKLIQGSSGQSQKRLRGLQFQIDAKRKIHQDSPLGACVAVSKMMHESFEQLRCELNKVTDSNDPLSQYSMAREVKDLAEETSATVLQFRG